MRGIGGVKSYVVLNRNGRATRARFFAIRRFHLED
jgi:hypothetical protein